MQLSFLTSETAPQRIVVSGDGPAALDRLRPLLKSGAHITVYAAGPAPEIEAWARGNRLTLIRRAMRHSDIRGARHVLAPKEIV